MNGLSLRISGARNKTKVSAASIVPVTIPFRHKQYFENFGGNIAKFLTSTTAEEQLDAIKKLTSDEEISKEAIDFLAIVFLAAEPKHPIQCLLKRYVIKTDRIQDLFERRLIDELNHRVASAESASDIKSMVENVTAILSCGENFPTGMRALKNCTLQLALFQYLEKCLVYNINNLQSSKCLCPTEKNEMYSLIHNTLRALLSIAQKLNTDNHRLLGDSFRAVYASIEMLFDEKEVQMDTKSLCAILKLTMFNFENSRLEWTKFLSTIADKDCCTPESALNMVCLYNAVVTVVSIEELLTTKVTDVLALDLLVKEVLRISQKFSVEPIIALSVARTIVNLTKSLQSLPGRGTSAVLEVLAFVWAHLEHFMDSVRHLTSQILANVLSHFALSHDNESQNAFEIFFKELIYQPTNKKAYYIGLSASANVLGTEAILQKLPNLVPSLINSLSDQAMQANVALTMERLLHRHIQEKSHIRVCPGDIYATWIEPILKHVYTSAETGNVDTTVLNILENVIGKAVRWEPKILDYIVPEAKRRCEAESLSVGDLKCVLVCLHIARRIGCLDNVRSEAHLWKGILPERVIRDAVVNSSEEIRILALSLLVETSKTTEPLARLECELVLVFLRYNINTQAPHLRHLALSLIKKLMKRFEGSYKLLQKQPSKEDSAAIYRVFLESLRAQCFDSLLPGANYSRRNIALQIIAWCQQLHLDGCQSLWQEEYVRRLTEHLEDSYENNKALALEILTGLVNGEYQGKIGVNVDDAILQASSVKPPDCLSAAYKLKLLLNIMAKRGNKESACLELIGRVWSGVKEQLSVATDSLLAAASRGPMYGLILCTRYLLADIDPDKLSRDGDWTVMIQDIISTCFEVTQVVSPVVNNSSPEGHLPMDGSSQDTLRTGVTAQMLLLCAWRCVKEVSLLLGEISSSLHTRDEDKDGILTHEDVARVGDHFTELLSETKHRGAFEQAYVGFTKLCARLWRCKNAALRGLPGGWLEEVLRVIGGGGRAGLCATRRSAGVPFMIQALVTTNLQESGSTSLFHDCMRTLLTLANSCDVSVEGRTHSINILRTLFRNTGLGEVVGGHVGGGLLTALRGFDANTWAERNCSTLLFSALMVRVFGVQRSKDSDRICVRNKMTGRTFFMRYPALYDFMLEKLKEVTSCENSENYLRPSLYPVLLLLARLYPYSLEETSTDLKLVSFAPHVIACASSCVLKTRQLAARALVPLISQDRYIDYLKRFLQTLGDRGIKRNYCHGILLQVIRLLEWKPESLKVDTSSVQEMSDGLLNTLWILEDALTDTPCYVTADEYTKVVNLLLMRFPEILQENEYLQKVKSTIEAILKFQVKHAFFGRDIFMSNALYLYILMLLRDDYDADVLEVIASNLENDSYEVILTALNVILLLNDEKHKTDNKILKHIGVSINENKRNKIAYCIEKSNKIKENLLSVIKININLECTQKALMILSNFDDTQSDIVGDNDTSKVITGLLNKIENEHENISHIFIRSLQNYIKNVNDIEDVIKLDIVNVIYESCSGDNTDEKRKNCVQFLQEHLIGLVNANLELSSPKKFEYYSTIWSSLVTLLEDDDPSIRQDASDLIVTLHQKHSRLHPNTGPVISTKAAGILLDTVQSFHDESDGVAALMVIALLDFNSEVCIDDYISEESRVFDQSEKYNTHLEEIFWTKECAIRIRKKQAFETVIMDEKYSGAFKKLCAQNYNYFCQPNVRNETIDAVCTVNPKVDFLREYKIVDYFEP